MWCWAGSHLQGKALRVSCTMWKRWILPILQSIFWTTTFQLKQLHASISLTDESLFVSVSQAQTAGRGWTQRSRLNLLALRCLISPRVNPTASVSAAAMPPALASHPTQLRPPLLATSLVRNLQQQCYILSKRPKQMPSVLVHRHPICPKQSYPNQEHRHVSRCVLGRIARCERVGGILHRGKCGGQQCVGALQQQACKRHQVQLVQVSYLLKRVIKGKCLILYISWVTLEDQGLRVVYNHECRFEVRDLCVTNFVINIWRMFPIYA